MIGACFITYVDLIIRVYAKVRIVCERKMIMLKTGAKIKIRDRTGTIVDVNRLIKCYLVMYSKKRGELVPFDYKEKAANG